MSAFEVFLGVVVVLILLRIAFPPRRRWNRRSFGSTKPAAGELPFAVTRPRGRA